MKKLLILVLLTLPAMVWGQQGTVKGRVIDAKTGENVEYATVALLSPQDSTLKGGTVTESNGTFSLKAPYGTYLLRIRWTSFPISARQHTS